MSMHQRRKELEDSIKHARNYSWRFIKQSFSNFWQTIKGQQILQVSVCAFVSLGYNIYWGVIEWDKASINTQSIFYFSLTLFILVALISILTAPFHLDREREETIKELETTAQPILATKEKDLAIVESLPSLSIRIAEIGAFIYGEQDLILGGENKLLQNAIAYSLEFRFKPTINVNNSIKLEAFIQIDNEPF